MPAGTFPLEVRKVEVHGSLIFSRVLADLFHQVGIVAVVVSHVAFCRTRKGRFSPGWRDERSADQIDLLFGVQLVWAAGRDDFQFFFENHQTEVLSSVLYRLAREKVGRSFGCSWCQQGAVGGTDRVSKIRGSGEGKVEITCVPENQFSKVTDRVVPPK